MLTGSWNVRILFRTGSVIMLTQQLIQYNLDIRAIQETREQGKYVMDTKTHTFFLVGKEGGKHEYRVTFVVKREVINNVLVFKAVNGRTYSLTIQTK